MPTEGIRVLLVDDHLIVRQGLAYLLAGASDVSVVGETDSGEEALHLSRTLRPDIVLMDVRMPGMGGVAATEAIRRHHPGAKVIGLSTFADDATVASMIAAGAYGHLSKAVTFDELVDAIRQVHAGGTAVARAVGPGRSAELSTGIAAAITGQQRRVLALLAKGFTNAEIAGYLGISASTVGYHVGAILTKLGASNRAEAAATAIRERMIDERDL